MRSDLDRLSDLNEAIGRIREKLPRTKDEFTGSDLLQIWVLYHIQILGEAANHQLSGTHTHQFPGRISSLCAIS